MPANGALTDPHVVGFRVVPPGVAAIDGVVSEMDLRPGLEQHRTGASGAAGRVGRCRSWRPVWASPRRRVGRWSSSEAPAESSLRCGPRGWTRSAVGSRCDRWGGRRGEARSRRGRRRRRRRRGEEDCAHDTSGAKERTAPSNKGRFRTGSPQAHATSGRLRINASPRCDLSPWSGCVPASQRHRPSSRPRTRREHRAQRHRIGVRTTISPTLGIGGSRYAGSSASSARRTSRSDTTRMTAPSCTIGT